MLTIRENERRISFVETLKAQGRVLFALMLRDIKTRWGSSPAYVITFLWPLLNILILVGLWTAFGRVTPYGESSVLWFSISMLPFMTCTYVARFVLFGLLATKPLMAFPVIKVTDIVFSRIIIEILNSVVLVALLFIWLWILDVNFFPHSIVQAVLAMSVAILLGLGMGIANGLIGLVFPMWVTGFMLVTIILWITSGVMFLPSAMPAEIRDWLYWQPVVHLVEWMREAYYPGYQSLILDKYFILGYSLVMIVLGLAIERFARGRIMI